MPLIKSKSKEAFDYNFKELKHSGKPEKQALGIAYSIQRKAAGKRTSSSKFKKKD